MATEENTLLENPAERRTVYYVNPARVSGGVYKGCEFVGVGDIVASYSGDRIGANKPIRRPFEWQGSLWVCTGMVWWGEDSGKRNEHDAYRLVLPEMFSGKAITYGERTATEELCAIARESPEGFYHGVIVKHGKNRFVLRGPEAVFLAENSPQDRPGAALQLALF